MKKIILAFLILSFFIQNTYSQQDTDLRELFLAAESYFLFEEFNEALPLYLRIHRQQPENDNINFKIGVCLLNDPYQKEKSIAYLEEAVKNINPKYKEDSYKETGAPLESLFYLGNAYRVNNKLDKAKEYYMLFLNRMDPEVYDSDLVQEQIDACDEAELLMKTPVDIEVSNLSDRINTRFADMNPVISGDETKLAFVSKLQFYDAVFYTEKVNGEWTAPRNIIPELGVDGDVYPTCLSFNGTEMYVYRNDDYIGNLYVTRIVNGRWTPLQKLGDNINTKYWESHASISKDGKTLYFSSNRKGGFGGLDIYRSKRMRDGSWGPAVNLGPIVNSRYNDDTPFITEDEKKLYFSSYGHQSMGGYDIFVSKKISDTVWAIPGNMGYPVNTTDDDQFFNPVHNGAAAYYSRYEEDGFGRHDIYRYIVYNDDNPRLYRIRGLIDYSGEPAIPANINISVVNKQDRDTVASVHPSDDGRFSFDIPSGSYNVYFDSEKFKPYVLSLEVPEDSPHEGFDIERAVALELKPVILPPKDISSYLAIREDSIKFVDSDDPVRIRYNAEPGTIAEILVENKDRTIFTDTLLVDRRRQSFEFVPEPGENEVNITLKDNEGNETSRTVTVIYQEEEPDTQTRETSQVEETQQTVQQSDVQTTSEAEALRVLLTENTEGNLHEFLNNLNTQEEGLNSQEDLIEYLYNLAGSHSFTREDVDEALFKAGVISEMDLLLKELSGLTDNMELKQYLLDLDAEDEGISTVEELFKHLYEESENQGYTASDVDELYRRYNNLTESEKLINALAGNADGELKKYLEDLDPSTKGISDLSGLVEHLMENTDQNGYSTQDVMDAVKGYVNENTASGKEETASRLSQDKVTGELLSGLDEEEKASMSEDELLNYIFSQGEAQNISDEDIIRSILKTINPDPLKVVEGVKVTAEPGIRQLVEMISEVPDSAVTVFDNLLEESGKHENTDRTQVVSAFREYLKNRNLIDFLNAMKKYSEGDLLETLENLDLKKEGIKDRKELIDYLVELSEFRSYTQDDVFRAAVNADRDLQFEKFLDRMIRLSADGLKEALLYVKTNKPGINNINDLIDFLLANTEKYGYSAADVYELHRAAYGDSVIISGVPDQIQTQESDNRIREGIIKTVVILLIEGLIILILILLSKRKRRKEKDS